MRGKDTILHSYATACGITPACAGKRHSRANAKAAPEDHPRVCGEKRIQAAIKAGGVGSPPRVRGKEQRGFFIMTDFGITPACAGKSRHYTNRILYGKDHPRVCGEKRARARILCRGTGSPPRVRGKAHRSSGGKILQRITPACAGKSCAAHPKSGSYRDHPRVCGEKYPLTEQQGWAGGSPPRVRGKEY